MSTWPRPKLLFSVLGGNGLGGLAHAVEFELDLGALRALGAGDDLQRQEFDALVNALDLVIDGHDDWYLPAQDELEVLYRNLKPGTQENYCWARSGINLSAVEPTRPYTPALPAQTLAEAFQAGAGEAFAESYYWSSTQHASHSVYAWCQYFDNGYQDHYGKSSELRARAVRRLIL